MFFSRAWVSLDLHKITLFRMSTVAQFARSTQQPNIAVFIALL